MVVSSSGDDQLPRGMVDSRCPVAVVPRCVGLVGLAGIGFVSVAFCEGAACGSCEPAVSSPISPWAVLTHSLTSHFPPARPKQTTDGHASVHLRPVRRRHQVPC